MAPRVVQIDRNNLLPESRPAKVLASIFSIMEAYITKASHIGQSQGDASVKECATWVGGGLIKSLSQDLNHPGRDCFLWAQVVQVLHLSPSEVCQPGRRPTKDGAFQGCIQLTADEVNAVLLLNEDR